MAILFDFILRHTQYDSIVPSFLLIACSFETKDFFLFFLLYK
jgi:hypothetical protein